MNGSSPLSRGIPEAYRPRLNRIRIIPALAGNTYGWQELTCPRWDHPRSRGEYAAAFQLGSMYMGSSPLSRGIRRAACHRASARRIIPALAGNTRCKKRHLQLHWDHPRSRGEYNHEGPGMRNGIGSSPLSRGIHRRRSPLRRLRRIIPALAGNTSAATYCTRTGRDHPRSRGEYRHG